VPPENTLPRRLQTIEDPDVTAELFAWAEGLKRETECQQTLGGETDWLSYIEAHSGAPTAVKLLPADPGEGIRFTDEHLRDPIPADLSTVDTKALCVCVERHGLHVNNVEHLLSCLYAFGIDNATVLVRKTGLWARLVWKRSLPLFTNSVLEFIQAFHRAGIVEQPGSVRDYRTIRGKHTFKHDLREDRVTIEPGPGHTTIHYASGYPQLEIPDQEIEIELTPARFLAEVSEARTLVNQFNRWPYPIAKQLGKLSFLSYGYGVGVNPENAVVRLRHRTFSRPRYGGEQHELVRHKVVDFLAAVRFLGFLRGVRLTVVKSGHAFDLEAVREIDKLLVEA